MPKDESVYVSHMLDSAKRAIRLLQGRSRADFDADETLRLALTRLIQMIGEAARRVPSSFCDLHPAIPWKAIVGMRNKLVHDYLGVDEQMVWSTVSQELPGLVRELEKVARPADGG